MTRRRPAAAGPIPGRSMPPGDAWGVAKQVARSSARNVAMSNGYVAGGHAAGRPWLTGSAPPPTAGFPTVPPGSHTEQDTPDQEPQVPQKNVPPQRRTVDRTRGADQPAQHQAHHHDQH